MLGKQLYLYQGEEKYSHNSDMTSAASAVVASQYSCTFVHLLSTLIFKYIKFTWESLEIKVARSVTGSWTSWCPWFFLLESESCCLQQCQATFSCCCCDAHTDFCWHYIVVNCAAWREDNLISENENHRNTFLSMYFIFTGRSKLSEISPAILP